MTVIVAPKTYVPPRVLSAADRHLASRFSFGANADLGNQIRASGSGLKWFEKQLAYTLIADTPGNAVAGWFPRLSDSATTAGANILAKNYSAWDYGHDLASSTVVRKIVSRRQVHEVMTDFWSNLLYIPAYEDRSAPWRSSYDRMIRKNALGTFRAMLQSAIVHPAMSGYLTNFANTRTGLNENLGREVLELHTVGRPTGYTESDVKNSARLLTGFKVDMFRTFRAYYEPGDHYVGPVKVLGFKHANSSRDGRAAVNAYLAYLASHPSTAQRIAERLCIRFVSDNPSASIVAAVKAAYLKSGTDIKSTLRALIRHADFPKSASSKIRTPIEDVVNAARVLGMTPTKPSSEQSFARQILWMTGGMGQHQFYWPRPDGFPEQSSAWVSPARILRSWNLHYALAGNWWSSSALTTATKASALPTVWPRTLEELTDHQSRLLLGIPATTELREAVSKAVHAAPTLSLASADVSDWLFTLVRGTVLNSPRALLR